MDDSKADCEDWVDRKDFFADVLILKGIDVNLQRKHWKNNKNLERKKYYTIISLQIKYFKYFEIGEHYRYFTIKNFYKKKAIALLLYNFQPYKEILTRQNSQLNNELTDVHDGSYGDKLPVMLSHYTFIVQSEIK